MSIGNVPRPLENAPARIFHDDRMQMSFGERAALEGVLSQLRPDLAVEIGSAQGGSLERIARHSKEVHAFDIAPPALGMANVFTHPGDSRFTLPSWLAEREREIDFALVDGDHTTAGARSDIFALLDACGGYGSVILIHDVANDAVAAAVGGIAEHPAVVYWEPDFVAGYVFAEGSFAGQRWGGLGLVVTGDRATDGYRSSPTQTLYRRREK
jgi:hypothetical protein